MKKLIIITLSVLALCSAVNYTVVSASTDIPTLTAGRTYILREYNGRIACFEENALKPFIITEVRVSDLPPADRTMLADGIRVTGAKQLSRALEDYRT